MLHEGSLEPGGQAIEQSLESQQERELYTAASGLFEHQRVVGDTKEFIRERNSRAERFRTTFLQTSLDKNRTIAIIEKARCAAFKLPQSMFLSPEAFDKFEEEMAGYQFITGDTHEIRETLGKLPKNQAPLTDDERTDVGSRYAVAINDGKVVGTTSYEPKPGLGIEVSYQTGSREHPGAGLGLLRKIVEESRMEGAHYVILRTFRTPLGLGNLGFKPWTDADYPEIPYYKLDLTETSEPEEQEENV